MSAANLAIAALGVAFAALFGVAALLRRHTEDAKHSAERFACVELKVDTMWDFQMRRGYAEGRMSDIITRNSPLRVRQDLWDALAPLHEALKAFYCDGGSHMNERDQFVELESRFGERLVDAVCIPLKISQGQCLLGAAIVGRRLAGLD